MAFNALKSRDQKVKEATAKETPAHQHRGGSECPNCFTRGSWNGKKCSRCGATST